MDDVDDFVLEVPDWVDNRYEWITEMNQRSTDHVVDKIERFNSLLDDIPLDLAPADYHGRATLACLTDLYANKKIANYTFTHRVRRAVFARSERFHPYISGLYK